MTSTPEASAAVIPQWTLADRLRKIRQMAGMGQRDFSAQLEVPPSRYAQWEAGNNKPRDVVAVARRIELLTGVPASWTLGVHDNGPRPTASDEGREVVRRLGLEPRTH
ncbi:helix-turn-helix domain-containing protein [Pseudokineococcus marinus]|uniref:Helix-turn-helix transcriptional regulator n=1 Tax=Pseudokineococcus marinus TaxID=351215 RepID=A0A849BJJ1_9ACTN|nr:helix-turn-helix transcriptional regulator [Pseudokineococcus marinus]